MRCRPRGRGARRGVRSGRSQQAHGDQDGGESDGAEDAEAHGPVEGGLGFGGERLVAEETADGVPFKASAGGIVDGPGAVEYDRGVGSSEAHEAHPGGVVPAHEGTSQLDAVAQPRDRRNAAHGKILLDGDGKKRLAETTGAGGDGRV